MLLRVSVLARHVDVRGEAIVQRRQLHDRPARVRGTVRARARGLGLGVGASVWARVEVRVTVRVTATRAYSMYLSY